MSFLSLTSSAAGRRVSISPCMAILLADDEGQDEPEQREGFDEPDPDEHRAPDHTGGFGLAGHGLHRLAHEDPDPDTKSEEHTSELQSRENLVCRLLLEKKK